MNHKLSVRTIWKFDFPFQRKWMRPSKLLTFRLLQWEILKRDVVEQTHIIWSKLWGRLRPAAVGLQWYWTSVKWNGIWFELQTAVDEVETCLSVLRQLGEAKSKDRICFSLFLSHPGISKSFAWRISIGDGLQQQNELTWNICKLVEPEHNRQVPRLHLSFKRS